MPSARGRGLSLWLWIIFCFKGSLWFFVVAITAVGESLQAAFHAGNLAAVAIRVSFFPAAADLVAAVAINRVVIIAVNRLLYNRITHKKVPL
jgi:hypothetical protein